MDDFKQSTLWQTAFPASSTDFPEQRQRIVQAYERFRERVSQLLGLIKAELPDLTLHDITHVDALWQVASEIAGPDYPLNPAEALVLGGAFLLHDAAHCRAAYPGGLAELQATAEWRDSAAQRKLDPATLTEGSEDFQAVLFDTLRTLHPRQARELPFAEWKDSDGTTLCLFPDDELRDAYGDLIGQIAQSHWSHPHELEVFAKSTVTAPSCLSPASWTVDPLKLAILLRVADACHMDAKRAPRFLMLLKQPQGISSQHWRFQSKLHQVKCDIEREELILSGSPFPAGEQTAWWLAYDAACLADRELSAADSLLRDHQIERLAAREIAGIKSPQSFARQVPTKDWYPVDTSLRISNIQSVVERFGGEKLYGDKPWLALRELIQNARDAIHAARSLGYLSENEGEIEVAIEDADGGHWLHVTDNGIGMSRYVLTEVLLDFGHSLWRSADLNGEWSGLAASGFEAIGQFGIGFFSIFMLGNKVRVSTRRCIAKESESDRGWVLEFCNGIQERPVLRQPVARESRRKAGTLVSVFLSSEKLVALYPKQVLSWDLIDHRQAMVRTCGHLAPAINIDLYANDNGHRVCAVRANDWMEISEVELLRRTFPVYFERNSYETYWKELRKLTEIRSATGTLVRRCALPISNNRQAIGVTGGILSGYIDGMTGIIFSQPQTDLSRQKAIPSITKAEFQRWANHQADIASCLGNLSVEDSVQLAAYGSSHEKLTVGKFAGNDVPYSKLIEYLISHEKLIVFDDDFYHDEDDPCDLDQFECFFSQYNEIFIFQADQWAWGPPEWLDVLPDCGVETGGWTLEHAFIAALDQAWGGRNNWSKVTQTTSVGVVGSEPIFRDCDIYTRLG